MKQMISNAWLEAIDSMNVRRAARAAVLALALGSIVSTRAADAPGPAGQPDSTTPPPAQAVPDARAGVSRATVSVLDQRVQLLAKELDLDSRQQAGVRNILLQQRAEVSRVWADDSVPAAVRVAATRAIGDKTADRIRALLTDEQKKKYNPPKPQHQPPTDSSGRSVEDWLRAANPAGPQPLGGVTAAE
jgi:hypothetical protein